MNEGNGLANDLANWMIAITLAALYVCACVALIRRYRWKKLPFDDVSEPLTHVRRIR